MEPPTIKVIMSQIRDNLDNLLERILADHQTGDILSRTTLQSANNLKQLLDYLDALPSQPSE